MSWTRDCSWVSEKSRMTVCAALRRAANAVGCFHQSCTLQVGTRCMQCIPSGHCGLSLASNDSVAVAKAVADALDVGYA